MSEPNRLILSLCDYSGVWSQPYVDAGYTVIRIDSGFDHSRLGGRPYRQVQENLWHLSKDLTQELPAKPSLLLGAPYGVLAAPSCTCFCRPGAQHWFTMDFTGKTRKDVALFRACLELCKTATGWWALENPPGRHGDFMPELGLPSWQYQPWEYGDAWTKQTYIWGTAKKPPVVAPVQPAPLRRTPNGKTQGRIAFLSGSAKREREKTPSGFARAFFEANP